MSSMGIMIVVVLLLSGWRMFTDASTEHEYLRCSADITTDDEFIANKNKMLETMHLSTSGIHDNRLRPISYGRIQQYYLGNRYKGINAITRPGHRVRPSQPLGLYGRSWCNLSYTDKECLNCVGIAVDAIKEGCGNALRVEYNGTYCGVRYADYPF